MNATISIISIYFGFESFQVRNEDSLAFQFDDSLIVKPAQVPRNQFTNRSNLRRDFLVADVNRELQPAHGALAAALCHAQQDTCQALPHGGKRKFFDQANEVSQPSPNHLQNFKPDLRVLKEERAEVLLSNQDKGCLCDSDCRGWIISTVKNGQLRNGAPRVFKAKHLLPAIGRGLENPNRTRPDDIQSLAGITLREDELIGRY